MKAMEYEDGMRWLGVVRATFDGPVTEPDPAFAMAAEAFLAGVNPANDGAEDGVGYRETDGRERPEVRRGNAG